MAQWSGTPLYFEALPVYSNERDVPIYNRAPYSIKPLL